MEQVHQPTHRGPECAAEVSRPEAGARPAPAASGSRQQEQQQQQ